MSCVTVIQTGMDFSVQKSIPRILPAACGDVRYFIDCEETKVWTFR